MPPNTLTLTRPLVLVGMMGAGKTAIGGALARKLGVQFLDSDEELVRAADRSIAEIFERDGEGFFRARETEVISRLLDGVPAVLSTGGGAFLSEVNRKLINTKGISVWLQADLPLLWSRVRHKTTRPLLRTDDPLATLTEIFNARTPIYAHAQLSVEARPEYSIDDMADKVIQTLKDANYLKETDT
ncbi:shikimate kinase [Litoreibacter albidus]|uniref:Shikimate kinase n=1 Tax=Litoreibacter albidus TaxID=670155 RepID=A0A1H2Z272_9RHOB|nr:shikimate kinase [Litoreibacter albidus]SDX10889.1 shikimate kinase [Litoreibacter albidus]